MTERRLEKNGCDPTETAFAGGRVQVDLNMLFSTTKPTLCQPFFNNISTEVAPFNNSLQVQVCPSTFHIAKQQVKCA